MPQGTEQTDKTNAPSVTPGRKPLLVGLLLAVTLHAFAELAIVTVLPVISRELDGARLYGIAFSAYLLTSLISIVWSGHMTDDKGPVVPFVAGLVVFSIGLIWASLAQNMWMFVAARGVQGLGGGAFFAVIYAAINRGWDDHQRARIMALMSSAWVIPGLVAPAAAGAIAEFFSWRVVFIVLVPFVAVTLILSLKGLRTLGPGDAHDNAADKTLDAFRIAAGIAVVLVAVSRSLDLYCVLLLGGAVGLAMRPLGRILPPGGGASRRILVASLGAKFLLIFGFFGAETFLPLGLVELHGLTAFVAGIVLTVASLSWSGAAFYQARLATSVSPRALATGGMMVAAISIAFLTVILRPGVPYWWAFVFWGVAGGGIGVVYNTVATSAMAHTQKGKEGATSVASGLAEGMSIALAAGIGGAVLNAAERNAGPLAPAQGLDLGIGIIWTLCAVVVAVGGLVSFWYLEANVRPVTGPVSSKPQVSSDTVLPQD